MKHVLPVTLFALIISIFFAHLFYPEPRLFLNPEYGRSDISHFNIPVHYIYDQALSRGEMPLWSQAIGSGFPIYAESQIGAWYLPNLLLYGALPFWIAFNMSYLIAFFIAATGMYFLAYTLSNSRLIGFGAGMMFAFSGYFIGHTNHINMLHAASLIPWAVYFLRRLSSMRMRWFMLLSLVLSQQLLSGHLQTSFITGLILMSYASIGLLAKKYRQVFRQWLLVISAFLFSLLLSAIQLIPSFELHGLSVRSQAFSLAETTLYSFHPKSLLTLLNPYALGKLQDGTYEFLKDIGSHGNIFWETNIYFGLVSLGLLLYSLRYVKRKEIGGMWNVLLGGLLLMLAKHSPLYFVFSIPPFNIFTTPARFTIVFLFFAVMLCATVLKTLRHDIQKICVVLICIDVCVVWYSYGLTLPVSTYLNPPQTAEVILDDASFDTSESRVMNFDSGRWNTSFLNTGWADDQEFADYFNEVSPNMQVLWGLRHHREYVGRIWTQRKNIFDQYLVGILDDAQESPPRDVAMKLLSLASVDYVVTSNAIQDDALEKMYDRNSYMIYRNSTARPRALLTDSVQKVDSVEDFIGALMSKESTPESAYLEDAIWTDKKKSAPLRGSATFTKDEDRFIELAVQNNKEAVLVLADLYYPGWEATIDGEKTAYYPANIIQRAVVVPAGKHTVTFSYNPPSYTNGKAISLVAHLIALLGMFLPFSKVWPSLISRFQ